MMSFNQKFALLLLIIAIGSCCCNYSFLPFRKLPLKHENRDLESVNGELYGMMKVLTFNNTTSLFVGGRSVIYRFNIQDLSVEATTRDMNDPIWTFVPIYNRTYQSGNRQRTETEFEPIYSTIDSCLSFVDRVRMTWTRFDDEKMSEVFSHFPGAGMRFWNYGQWIRFRKQFEDFVCKGSFIRGLEKIKLANGTEVLWACGTFGTFPKAFLLNPETLEIIDNNTDSTLPTCARWPDEPTVTKVLENGDFYIGTGWGLYKPFKGEAHTKKNLSMMLYSDWKMLTSGHHWFTRMAMILGRDVVFARRVFETTNHLYFFGHEITPSLTYINSLTREVPQSFMLRICKNDTGFKYTAEEDVAEVRKWRNISGLDGIYTLKEVYNLTLDQFFFSYSSAAYDDTYRVPTRHFVSAQKFPFGCYLKRYDGAQSLNRFWGEQNIIYFNRLADVNISFNWVDERGNEFRRFNRDERYGRPDQFPDDWLFNDMRSPGQTFNPNTGVWNPLVAAFSSPGFWQRRRWRRKGRHRTGEMRPKGAICQFQITEWKTDAKERMRKPPPPDSLYKAELESSRSDYEDYRHSMPKNKRQFAKEQLAMFVRSRNSNIKPNVSITNAAEEFMALYGSQTDSFFSRATRWLQGGQIPGYWGLDFQASPNLTAETIKVHKDALKAGQCLTKEATAKLTKEEFLDRMKTASTAWPTEWDSTITKFFDAVYHMNPMQVAGDNASFVYDGVEFAKMFVMRWNYSDYKHGNETSPLLYVTLVTTEAEVFRVVMCDISSIAIKDVTCEMKHTDQPYVTRMFQYMRRNHFFDEHPTSKDGKKITIHDPDVKFEAHSRVDAATKFKQFRVSSLLSIWRGGTKADEKVYPHDEDWQAPLLKDAEMDDSGETLTLLTSKRIMQLDVSAPKICDSYKACIHCASDPFCAWDQSAKKCKTYKESPNGLQDVLNRGFACNENITLVSETFTVRQRDAAIRLPCENWKYFRGSIRWYYNDTEIDLSNSLHRAKFVISELDKSLVVFAEYLPHEPDSLATFVCKGVSIDDEKYEKRLAVYKETPGIKPCFDRCASCNKKNEILHSFLSCRDGVGYCKGSNNL